MKQYSVLFLVCTIAACNKSNLSTPPATSTNQVVVGKWTLKNTSLQVMGKDHSVIDSRSVTGAASDYWDFQSDGTLLIDQGERVKQLTYRVLKVNTLEIAYLGSADTLGFSVGANISLALSMTHQTGSGGSVSQNMTFSK